MRIGVDIDGVLRDFVGSLRFQYRIDYPEANIKKVTEWGIEKFFPMGNWIYDYMYKWRPKEIFELADEYDNAVWMMRELRCAGHDIWILTTQPQGTEKYTLNWLEAKCIEYDHLVFTEKKLLVDCNIYLDDSPNQLASLGAAGKWVVAFDRPWNQKWGGLRVKTHSEFLILVEMENNK